MKGRVSGFKGTRYPFISWVTKHLQENMSYLQGVKPEDPQHIRNVGYRQ